jgi:hypothetical protein
MGPKHEDAEFVNFPWQHFHIDWRFAPSRLYNSMAEWFDARLMYGAPIQCPDTRGNRVVIEGPTLRLMKCKRIPPPYPHYSAMRSWLPKLTEHFACAKLVGGKCPHRGIPVEAMLRDGDVLTCPGHGLRFNAITGEVLRV